jgi:hypothetical protein
MTSSKTRSWILSILLTSLIITPLGCRSNDARPVATHDDYFRLASEIASDLVALKEQFPYLAEIEVNVDQKEAPREFRVHVFCLHGQTGRKPNPEWTGTFKAPRTLPVYSQDGLRLNVTLFIGSYMWQRVMPRESIGQLQVLYFAEGPMQDDALREVRRVLDRHRASFVKEYEL